MHETPLCQVGAKTSCSADENNIHVLDAKDLIPYVENEKSYLKILHPCPGKYRQSFN